jgi:uncharacterized protein YmfQ (DUF2313 family)
MPNLGYGKYPYGYQGYKFEDRPDSSRLHYYAMRKINPLKSIENDTNWDDEVDLEGKYFENAYWSDVQLLAECFGDTADQLLASWEFTYGLASTGSITDRRARIVVAMRARGGQSIRYFTTLATALGYTSVISESVADPFIIGTTTLPHTVFDPYNYYKWVVTTTGVTSAPDLEALFNDLKPAYTSITFIYA